MIEDALSAEKPFSAVIMYDVSWFSMNSADLVRYKKLLEDAGVALLSTMDDTIRRAYGIGYGVVTA